MIDTTTPEACALLLSLSLHLVLFNFKRKDWSKKERNCNEKSGVLLGVIHHTKIIIFTFDNVVMCFSSIT